MTVGIEVKEKIRIVVISLPIGDNISFVPDVPLAAVETALDGIRDRTVDLVLFPQYTAIEEDDRNSSRQGIVSALRLFAQDNRCYIVYNALRNENGRQSCVSVIVDREGKLAGEYTKTHHIEGLDAAGLTLGGETPVFELDFGKVALLAGTDLYFPEIAELYSVKGAELLLCSLGPSILRDDTEVQRLMRGRAIADYMYVAGSCYSSDNTMYMASNVELYNGASDEIDVSGDPAESFNAFGLGKHTGRAVVYDLRGETVAGTGRESGCSVCELDLRRKRSLKDYNFGTGCILFHQNQRGVFADLGRPFEPVTANCAAAKPVISFVHLPYKDTFRSTESDAYEPILERIAEAAARGSDLIVCSEYSRGDDGRACTAGLDGFLQGCSRIAGQKGCYIAVNEVIDRLNTSLVFDRNGEIIHKHVKVNTLCMMYEKKLPAGTEIEPIELDFGKVGIMICADSYCQEIPRIYGLKGADLIILQTQSWGYDANAINEGVARAWAIENGLYVMTSAFPSSQVVHRSNVIDPTGETIFASQYDLAGVYTVQLDLNAANGKTNYIYDGNGKVLKDRAFRNRLMLSRRPELYAPLATGLIDWQ